NKTLLLSKPKQIISLILGKPRSEKLRSEKNNAPLFHYFDLPLTLIQVSYYIRSENVQYVHKQLHCLGNSRTVICHRHTPSASSSTPCILCMFMTFPLIPARKHFLPLRNWEQVCNIKSFSFNKSKS